MSYYAGNFSNVSPLPWEGAYHSCTSQSLNLATCYIDMMQLNSPLSSRYLRRRVQSLLLSKSRLDIVCKVRTTSNITRSWLLIKVTRSIPCIRHRSYKYGRAGLASIQSVRKCNGLWTSKSNHKSIINSEDTGPMYAFTRQVVEMESCELQLSNTKGCSPNHSSNWKSTSTYSSYGRDHH
jgi:hypothetical protein